MLNIDTYRAAAGRKPLLSLRPVDGGHAMQIKSGVITGEGRQTMVHSDLLGEEADAYKSQFAFDPGNVQQNVPSFLGQPQSINDITNDWVLGINDKQDMSGTFIYAKILLEGRGVPYDPEEIIKALKR